jgi:hypothetical protein
MRTQSRDTSLKAEAVLIAMLRKAKPFQKFAQIRSLSQTTLSLSRRALRRKKSTLNETDINWLFVKHHYGSNLADRLQDYLKKKYHERT